MVRVGRYDVFDKWSVVCRSWRGEDVDVGVDRHNRPLLPLWELAAFAGGKSHCRDYLRLKLESLDAIGLATGADLGDGDLNGELSRLLWEIGHSELQARCDRLIETMKSSGRAVSCNAELPPRLADRLKEVFKLGALLGLRWTDDPGEIPNLELLRSKIPAVLHLRRYADDPRRFPFPCNAAKGKRNVLAMFCARFYGLMDVIHIHDICPDTVTLVDLDAECLEAMQQIYPRDWTYVHADYKDFLRKAEERGLNYDLIVADPWRSQCVEVAFDMLPRIMRRCTGLFIVHYVPETFEELGVAPDDLDGLSRALSHRTGVDVLVTERVERGIQNCWLVIREKK